MLPSLPDLLKLHFGEEKSNWFFCSTQMVMMPLEINNKNNLQRYFNKTINTSGVGYCLVLSIPLGYLHFKVIDYLRGR